MSCSGLNLRSHPNLHRRLWGNGLPQRNSSTPGARTQLYATSPWISFLEVWWFDRSSAFKGHTVTTKLLLLGPIRIGKGIYMISPVHIAHWHMFLIALTCGHSYRLLVQNLFYFFQMYILIVRKMTGADGDRLICWGQFEQSNLTCRRWIRKRYNPGVLSCLAGFWFSSRSHNRVPLVFCRGTCLFYAIRFLNWIDIYRKADFWDRKKWLKITKLGPSMSLRWARFDSDISPREGQTWHH